MTNSVTKPAPSARRRRHRLVALTCIAAALAVAPLAPAGALAAARPAAAASLSIWSGYINSTDGVRLFPVEDNSCLAFDEALTPAYLADPQNPINPAVVWGSSCTQSTATAATNAFVNDLGEFPALVAALGQSQGNALVMQGAEDPFGLGWSSTSVAELTSAQTQLVIVPGAGHFPWIEPPGLVLQTVAQFIG